MKAKPLEWREARVSDRWPRYSADSVFGRYEAMQWSDGSFGGSIPDSKEFCCDSLDEAKMICQTDYESRIDTARDKWCDEAGSYNADIFPSELAARAAIEAMREPKHPMQPIVWVNDVVRFKANNIIRHIIDHGSISLKDIAMLAGDPENGFTQEDQEQLAQLIGYSVSGFGDLSYASEMAVEEADRIAAGMAAARNHAP